MTAELDDLSNRWVRVIQETTGEATAIDDRPNDQRRSWVSLTLTALRSAITSGAVSETEGLIREAKLALALSRYGDPGDFSADLTVDRLVRRSFEKIDVPADLATCWEDLPLEQIR